MRRILSFLIASCVCIGVSDAAVRVQNSNSRGTGAIQSRTTSSREIAPSISTRTNNTNERRVTARTTTPTENRATVSRATTSGAASRSTTNRNTNVVQRTTTNTARTATPQQNTQTSINRAATKTSRPSRASTVSKTFGIGYNSCRDAYFTCMDQFCATADDTYRRCVCSSRLDEIKKKQRALVDAGDQIQNFKDLNIEVIPKTSAEVKAMLNASAGEYAASIAKDTSDSAQKLAGISAVLAKTKSKSLSTAGTLDIAGDINAIWATTDLASGVNIANLIGEPLYNAVHSQCAELVADHCESKSKLNMVISAYGMYIENDCALLSTALGKQRNTANATIRETEREMHDARLKNYDAHNSSSINDCVAMVRNDITSDAACGNNYVHCLDVSGLYLNKATGEPIYTSDFYQLETMLSLSGDMLTNQTNRLLVSELNRKRVFAEKSLSTCQDLADEVWDEFMRQAITEIYQGQQSRIRQVKDECLDVVNKCYDQQTQQLRDFTNTKEQLLLGSQLELSEQLCREKLAACSNLYGGGSAGLSELVNTMYNITSQKIAQNCLDTLKEYAVSICSVPATDTLHSYPYACRVYAPGEQKYAMMWACQNRSTNVQNYNGNWNGGGGVNGIQPNQVSLDSDVYYCPITIQYTGCASGYYLSDCGTTPYDTETDATPTDGNSCKPCLDGATCDGGTKCPVAISSGDDEQSSDEDDQEDNDETDQDEDPKMCGDYVGSLYQKIVRYAIQACMRPSEVEKATKDTTVTPISNVVLQDVNATMSSIRIAMSNSLKNECERLGGYWVTTQYYDGQEAKEPNTSGDVIEPYNRFYDETGANTKWGYCANPDKAAAYYGLVQEESETNPDETNPDDSGGGGDNGDGGNSGEDNGGE